MSNRKLPTRKGYGRDLRDVERLLAIVADMRQTFLQHVADVIREQERALQQIDPHDADAVIAGLDKAGRALADAQRHVPTPADMWELSGHTDTAALRAMLAPFAATMPAALVNGLDESLKQRRPSDHRHVLRWWLVVEGHDIRRLTWKRAYAYAAKRLAGTSAGAGVETMVKSYKRVNAKRAPG